MVRPDPLVDRHFKQVVRERFEGLDVQAGRLLHLPLRRQVIHGEPRIAAQGKQAKVPGCLDMVLDLIHRPVDVGAKHLLGP